MIGPIRAAEFRRFVVAPAISALAMAAVGAPAAAHATGPEPSTPVGQSPDAAATLAESFPELLATMQSTSAPRLAAVTPNGAAGRERRGRIVWSSLPMEVKGDPVDRTLVGDGNARTPRNPLVPTTVDLDATEGFAVGAGASAFSVVPVAAADASQQVVGDGVIHDDTHVETDSIVRAVSGGVETFELLRSDAAPEVFRYRVDGVRITLRQHPDGAIEVLSGARSVGRVAAPYAVDAIGRSVPISLQVDGDTVIFSVAHRSATVAYPILADPQWTANYDFSQAGQGNKGIFYDPEDPPGYDVAAVTGGSHPGITIRPYGGRAYTVADKATALFPAPPGATIAKADFRNVYRYNELNRQTMRLGLYGDGVDIHTDYSDYAEDTRTSIPLTDPSASAKFAVVQMFTPACQGGDDVPCPRVVPPTNKSRITVGQLVVTLVDPGAPSISATGDLVDVGGAWLKGDEIRDFDVEFSDNGSGVQSSRIDLIRDGHPAPLVAERVETCNANHSGEDQEVLVCPETTRMLGVPIDLTQVLEGRVRVVPHAKDYAGTDTDDSANGFWLRVDRSAPSVDALSGSLVGGPSAWVALHGPVTFDAETSDRYSGVKSLDLSITRSGNATPTAQRTIDLCDDPANSTLDQPCPVSKTDGLQVEADDLPDGPLELKAQVTDHVGYESAEASKTVYKDNGLPAATARGDLTDLEDEWTNETGGVPVTVHGKDRGSGVASLELFAKDGTGRRLVERTEVCNPATLNVGAGERCPEQASHTLSVDLGDVDSGEVQFGAYATDAAGNRDPSPDSWDTYVDHDPPSDVGRVVATLKNPNTVRVSWTPASDAESGIAGYEYRVVLADDQRETEWTSTPFPAAEIPAELKTSIVEVRAKDKTGNRGDAIRQQMPLYQAERLADGLSCPSEGRVKAAVKGVYNLATGGAPDISGDIEDLALCLRKMSGSPTILVRTIVPIDLYGLSGNDSNSGSRWNGRYDGLEDPIGKNVRLYISFMSHDYNDKCTSKTRKQVTLAVVQARKEHFLNPCEYPDNQLYRAFAKRFKSKLKDANVVAWSPWNEPNNPMFTLRGLGASSAAKVLAGYWRALKAVGLGAGSDQLVAGEIDMDNGGTTWLGSMHGQLGSAPDAWVVHDYKALVYGRVAPSTTKALGLGKDVWISETGFQVHNGNRPKGASSQAKRGQVFTDAGRHRKPLSSPRLKKVFYYGAEWDPDHWDTALWDEDGKPRPALCGIYLSKPSNCDGKH